jgi:tight adherence protein B
MRGLAVLAAGAAMWVLAAGWTPSIRLRHPSLPQPWVIPAALATGIGGALLTLAFLGVRSIAVAVGLLAASVPAAMDLARQRRRREELAAAWPDFLALLRGRVVAGETIPDAFIAAAERSPEPLRSSAVPIAEAVTFGDGFGAALDRLRAQLDDATADRVLSTIAAAHRSGGPRVGLVLTALGTSVADELRLRRAHFAALTEQRMTALVALIAPWGLLALSIATNPQSAESYQTHTGTIIVAFGLASTSLGYLAARRAAAMSQAPRVFE